MKNYKEIKIISNFQEDKLLLSYNNLKININKIFMINNVKFLKKLFQWYYLHFLSMICTFLLRNLKN